MINTGHYPSHYDRLDEQLEAMHPRGLVRLMFLHLLETDEENVEPETLLLYMELIKDHLIGTEPDIFRKYNSPEDIYAVLRKTRYGNVNEDGTVRLTGFGIMMGLHTEFPEYYRNAATRWIESERMTEPTTRDSAQ